MLRVAESITINRPVDDVWQFLIELENTPKWDTGVRETRKTSPGPAGMGTTFQNIGPFLGRESVREYKVTEFERPRKVTVELAKPSTIMHKALITYGLEPVPGGTRVTFSASAQLAGLFQLVPSFFLRRAQNGWQEDLANLKQLLESG
jgi:carbon monoxide dehydrogenase subunit G